MYETDKREVMLSLVMLFSFPCHHPLHFVEQVFSYDWLEVSREKLSMNAHHPVVDRILEEALDAGHGQRSASEAAQTYIEQGLSKGTEGMVSCCIEFKCLADEWRCLCILLNIPRPWVIDVSDGSERRPLAPAQLLPDPTLHVFGEIINVVLRLGECDGEHEFPLWCVLEGHGGELHILERACVQHMDDAPTVYGVSCEPVWMPRQNTVSFSASESIQHFTEHGSAGFFGSFCLLEGGDDFQSFFCGKFTKLSDLSFDGKSLSLFTLR